MTRLRINDRLSVNTDEIQWHATRAQGAGGQHVNKVSSAVHLRFDIQASSLPDTVKQRLLAMRDKRLNADGVIVIKSQQHRRQEKNLEVAQERLVDMIRQALHVAKPRRATRPTKASVRRRLERKARHSRLKASRRQTDD